MVGKSHMLHKLTLYKNPLLKQSSVKENSMHGKVETYKRIMSK